jgi:hypothetical protein
MASESNAVGAIFPPHKSSFYFNMVSEQVYIEVTTKNNGRTNGRTKGGEM